MRSSPHRHMAVRKDELPPGPGSTTSRSQALPSGEVQIVAYRPSRLTLRPDSPPSTHSWEVASSREGEMYSVASEVSSAAPAPASISIQYRPQAVPGAAWCHKGIRSHWLPPLPAMTRVPSRVATVVAP